MNTAATSTLEIKIKRVAGEDLEKEVDYKNFNKWFTKHIRVVKGGSTTLQECHLSYDKFLSEGLGRIPVNKKVFAQLLRGQLLPDRKTGTVRIATQRRVVIAGIELKENDVLN